MIQTLPTFTLPFKFKHGDVIIHAKTLRPYTVCGLPDEYLIEETWEPAYAYRTFSQIGGVKSIGPKIIRSQAKMEDGRFDTLKEIVGENIQPSL